MRSLHQSKHFCKPDTDCVVGGREESIRRQDDEEQETEVETEASPWQPAHGDRQQRKVGAIATGKNMGFFCRFNDVPCDCHV